MLEKEIMDSELWVSREKQESTYKRDLNKRIELINWVLHNMKNPDVEIWSLIEARMNETIQEINKKDSIFESDILDTELRVLDWIFYQVCINMQDETGMSTIQTGLL
jgi:hypothetical protein